MPSEQDSDIPRCKFHQANVPIHKRYEDLFR